MAEIASEILHSVEKLHPQDGDLYLIRVPQSFGFDEAKGAIDALEEMRKRTGVRFEVLILIGGLEEPTMMFEKVDDDTMRSLGWMRIPKEAPVDPLNFVTSEGACYHDFGKGGCPIEGCVYYGGPEASKRSKEAVDSAISQLKEIGALD